MPTTVCPIQPCVVLARCVSVHPGVPEGGSRTEEAAIAVWMGKRFETVDKRFEGVDKRFDDLKDVLAN